MNEHILRLYKKAVRILSYRIYNHYRPNGLNDLYNRINENIQYGFLEMPYGKSTIRVPLQNEYGKNYPSYATDIIHSVFDIKDSDIVVDVGGGANPLKRANIVVDLYPGETTHRSGFLKLYEHQKYYQKNVEDFKYF